MATRALDVWKNRASRAGRLASQRGSQLKELAKANRQKVNALKRSMQAEYKSARIMGHVAAGVGAAAAGVLDAARDESLVAFVPDSALLGLGGIVVGNMLDIPELEHAGAGALCGAIYSLTNTTADVFI